jgi:hypothetical protein
MDDDNKKYFNNFARRIMERYNNYGVAAVLPVHQAKEQSKCKDYDMDKIDLTGLSVNTNFKNKDKTTSAYSKQNENNV